MIENINYPNVKHTQTKKHGSYSATNKKSFKNSSNKTNSDRLKATFLSMVGLPAAILVNTSKPALAELNNFNEVPVTHTNNKGIRTNKPGGKSPIDFLVDCKEHEKITPKQLLSSVINAKNLKKISLAGKVDNTVVYRSNYEPIKINNLEFNVKETHEPRNPKGYTITYDFEAILNKRNSLDPANCDIKLVHNNSTGEGRLTTATGKIFKYKVNHLTDLITKDVELVEIKPSKPGSKEVKSLDQKKSNLIASQYSDKEIICAQHMQTTPKQFMDAVEKAKNTVDRNGRAAYARVGKKNNTITFRSNDEPIMINDLPYNVTGRYDTQSKIHEFYFDAILVKDVVSRGRNYDNVECDTRLMFDENKGYGKLMNPLGKVYEFFTTDIKNLPDDLRELIEFKQGDTEKKL
jgi:hypothetical protein